MVELAPENEAPGVITDHPFVPRSDNHFLCAEMVTRRHLNKQNEQEYGYVKCNLAEAAHTEAVMRYRSSEGTPYRCPDCVTKEVDVCVHGPGS